MMDNVMLQPYQMWWYAGLCRPGCRNVTEIYAATEHKWNEVAPFLPPTVLPNIWECLSKFEHNFKHECVKLEH